MSGHDIELGGEISFWVDARDGMDLDNNGQPDHEVAAERAIERLRNAAYDARRVHVQAKHLQNTPGALLAFVEEVSGRGHHILDITVGAPEPDGVPGPDLHGHAERTTADQPASASSDAGAAIPARAAIIAASIRLDTPSLSRMCVTWTLAVFGLMNSSWAI